MKVELRNIKHMPSLSEETECFSATIYLDGVKRGEASNRGHGGQTDIIPHGLKTEINAYATTLPDVVYGGMTLKMNAELLIDDLLGDELQRKQLKKLCAKKTLFREKGKTYGEGDYDVIKIPYGPAAIAWIQKHCPGASILNETLKEAP